MQLIEREEFIASEQIGRPRTITVLTLLALAAFVFSYLWAYALTGALVTAGLMGGWTGDIDPRPRNMALSFLALLTLFTIAGGMFKLLSYRQLRRIDAMAE